MFTRSTPLDHQTGPTYALVELPTRGPHQMHAPMPIYSLELLEAMSRAGVHKPVDGEAEGNFAKVRLHWTYGGAAIGLCWNHTTMGLDAENGGDYEAYGRAVLEELYEYGYPTEELGQLLTATMALLTRTALAGAGEKEVSKREDFSGRPSERTT